MHEDAVAVALPTLERIGEDWARGELTVAQEHFASVVLRGRLLAMARAGNPPDSSPCRFPPRGEPPPHLPQMPAYHLTRPDRTGITMVNIGTGPSNARTMTDHVAVLRPHAWIMLGHCAGLRRSQLLGDLRDEFVRNATSFTSSLRSS